MMNFIPEPQDLAAEKCFPFVPLTGGTLQERIPADARNLPAMALADRYPGLFSELPVYPGARTYPITLPDEEYSFLHEAAIVVFKGTVFAAWYNNRKVELDGDTPIRFSRSADGGRTWETPRVIADDPTGKILFCPPVFAVEEDRLYLLMNEMVAPDHMHALDLYLWNPNTEEFDFLWSRPIPFKLNTNAIRLENGKWMLPGRVGELDGLPITPAVLFSDSTHIDGEWRLVRVQQNGMLPYGEELVFPETCTIQHGGHITMFCRDDNRCVPLIYRSDDNGESWSGPETWEMPIGRTKIYSGTLSDGRDYLIANLLPARGHLAILFGSASNEGPIPCFTEGWTLQHGVSEELGYGLQWHYPCAWEDDGKLYVICTVEVTPTTRGAVVIVLPLQ